MCHRQPNSDAFGGWQGFAALLGRRVEALYCSERVECTEAARFLQGVVGCGAFGVLVDIDRLAAPLLSVLASQLKVLLQVNLEVCACNIVVLKLAGAIRQLLVCLTRVNALRCEKY